MATPTNKMFMPMIAAGAFDKPQEAMDTRPSLKQMIGMRLRLNEGAAVPFDFFECHRRPDDTVLVFIVVGNDSIVLEDEWKLFPSDGLITRLLLLMEKNP